MLQPGHSVWLMAQFICSGCKAGSFPVATRAWCWWRGGIPSIDMNKKRRVDSLQTGFTHEICFVCLFEIGKGLLDEWRWWCYFCEYLVLLIYIEGYLCTVQLWQRSHVSVWLILRTHTHPKSGVVKNESRPESCSLRSTPVPRWVTGGPKRAGRELKIRGEFGRPGEHGSLFYGLLSDSLQITHCISVHQLLQHCDYTISGVKSSFNPSEITDENNKHPQNKVFFS